VLIPDDAEKRALERRNRWGRFRETIRRYGLALTALELIGRRAGIDWMHEFARRRINQKHKDYLQ
jgi:heterodisulfide reductase subunit A-like polyferredoxin